MADITLILGGARSGKTARALALTMPPRAYVATAEVRDDEMDARVNAHKAERGHDWGLIEAPLDLVAAINKANGRSLLIDCLTLWLSNLMEHDLDVQAQTTALIAAMEGASAPIILVSNEIGLGLVPMEPLSRRFRDEQGRLNQRIAAAATSVEFIAAGLPLRLK